jgi:hypothetical protein
LNFQPCGRFGQQNRSSLTFAFWLSGVLFRIRQSGLADLAYFYTTSSTLTDGYATIDSSGSRLCAVVHSIAIRTVPRPAARARRR